MRAIKFRGKRIDNQKWVYGALFANNSEMERTFIIDNCQYGSDIDFRFTGHAVDPKTVGQFTGLKDKTGREIFEGDTVISCMPCDDEKPNIYHIGFNNGTFVFYRKLNDTTPARQWNDGINHWYSIENIESFETEIIGNIHDQES